MIMRTLVGVLGFVGLLPRLPGCSVLWRPEALILSGAFLAEKSDLYHTTKLSYLSILSSRPTFHHYSPVKDCDYLTGKT